MSPRLAALLLAGAVPLAGCGAIFGRLDEGLSPFRSVRTDVEWLRDVGDDHGLILLVALDLPISLALDGALLPFDLIAALRDRRERYSIPQPYEAFSRASPSPWEGYDGLEPGHEELLAGWLAEGQAALAAGTPADALLPLLRARLLGPELDGPAALLAEAEQAALVPVRLHAQPFFTPRRHPRPDDPTELDRWVGRGLLDDAELLRAAGYPELALERISAAASAMCLFEPGEELKERIGLALRDLLRPADPLPLRPDLIELVRPQVAASPHLGALLRRAEGAR